MAKKEGAFGLSHIFWSAAIGAAVGLLTGVFVDPSTLAISHFTEAGLAQTQVTQHLFGPMIDSYSNFMVENIWDPLRNYLGITSEIVAQSADGVSSVFGSTNNMMVAGASTTGTTATAVTGTAAGSATGAASGSAALSGMDMSVFQGI